MSISSLRSRLGRGRSLGACFETIESGIDLVAPVTDATYLAFDGGKAYLDALQARIDVI